MPTYYEGSTVIGRTSYVPAGTTVSQQQAQVQQAYKAATTVQQPAAPVPANLPSFSTQTSASPFDYNIFGTLLQSPVPQQPGGGNGSPASPSTAADTGGGGICLTLTCLANLPEQIIASIFNPTPTQPPTAGNSNTPQKPPNSIDPVDLALNNAIDGAKQAFGALTNSAMTGLGAAEQAAINGFNASIKGAQDAAAAAAAASTDAAKKAAATAEAAASAAGQAVDGLTKYIANLPAQAVPPKSVYQQPTCSQGYVYANNILSSVTGVCADGYHSVSDPNSLTSNNCVCNSATPQQIAGATPSSMVAALLGSLPLIFVGIGGLLLINVFGPSLANRGKRRRRSRSY
jgi:hypothetical protein